MKIMERVDTEDEAKETKLQDARINSEEERENFN